MEKQGWNNKGKIFFALSLIMCLPVMFCIFTGYKNLVNNTKWFLLIIVLLNCIIGIRNSLKAKVKERYSVLSYIIMIVTLVITIIVKIM